MKFVIILIVLIVQTSYSFIQVFTSKDWNKFKLKHDKTYSSLLEEKIRVEIFLQNLKIITKHNIDFALGRVSYEMGINHFSDMHPDEVLIEYTGDIDDQSSEDYENFKEYTPLQKEVNIPNTVDWRSSGAVTPVKNQGRCGSCWTFATTGVIEGQLYLKSNDQTPLSEQNLLDCAEKNYSNKGCRGGLTLRALQYIQDYGIQSENSYPYTSVQGDCQFNQQKSVITTKGYVKLPVNDEDSLKEAVASIGPIAVSILVTKKFPKYKQGVFYDSTCNDKTNHAVLVVGYGTDDLTNEDYWLVKNSWGVKWGSNGYIKMARNRNNNCNIAMRGVFPKL